MWTPRRVLLLLAGVVVFVGVYAVYARALGWLDGLPQLPERMKIKADGDFTVPPNLISPTILRLQEAFGPTCPEKDTQYYPTQLEFRNGESSVVLASGSPPFNTGSNRVVLIPFSMASFGKPRPAHLRQPGEVVEISTFHADKAVLEFDRPISNPNDMSKAKLIRMELLSDPENPLVPPDPRRGTVLITNNQRSTDANKFMVLRTQGPVFYRDPKNATPAAAQGPDVWTDAAVEIIDRQNLPRGFAAVSPPTALAKGDDLRDVASVEDILSGRRLPPPTVTAVGMRIYFEPEKATVVPNPPGGVKKGSAGFSGVRRVELLEKVLINLWVDASQTLVTPSPKADAAKTAEKPAGGSPLGVVEPPPAAAAVLGGLAHGIRVARQLDRALLQIETLGPFTYDVEKNTARFDVLPRANPNLPNDVQVTRVTRTGDLHKLFSQVLEIEFNGSPTGAQPEAGPQFKMLHAWTYTPGRLLTVSAETEQLEAYGHDLVHEQATSRTILYGAPLYAVQRGSVLSAGTPQKAAALLLAPGPDKRSTATVYGPGRLEMLDAATNERTITATWITSLAQTKEVVRDTGGLPRELDLFVFTDGAMFEDKGADFWLKGDVLKLWLAPGRAGPEVAKAESDGKPVSAGRPLPHRLQALGKVSSHSVELDVDRADHLNVLFRDEPAPKPKPPTDPPLPPAPAPTPTAPMNPAAPPPPAAGPLPPPEPAKPKPPLKLTARVIDTHVVRYPLPKADPKDAPPKPKAGEAALKYELRQARCEGQVVVHQDPDDPAKPRGVDILGNTVLIDQTPDGSILTVTGTDEKPGEVHFEAQSMVGPKVIIDQLHNVAIVEGRGALTMPTGSELNGNDLQQPEVIVIHWRDGMRFDRKWAEFTGKVNARQGESWVVCHQMEVTFDRPVYFNKLRKGEDRTKPAPKAVPKDAKAAPKKNDDSPKVDTVYCWRALGDAGEDVPDVWFREVIRDEKTKAIVRTQQVTAKELKVRAQVADERGNPYQMVTADGPGIVRIWQPGQKDMAAQPAPPMAPRPGQPAAPPSASDTEMKLTIVTFTGRMVVKDKGKVYQEAEFRDNIEVVNVPSDDPNATVELFRLPARSFVLRCRERMIVSTHKKPNGPPEQSMNARGNASVRSDEYEGYGEVVTYDGQRMTLYGDDPERPGNRGGLARIVSRFKGTADAGDTIIYERATNSYKTFGSTGSTIQTAPKK